MNTRSIYFFMSLFSLPKKPHFLTTSSANPRRQIILCNTSANPTVKTSYPTITSIEQVTLYFSTLSSEFLSLPCIKPPPNPPFSTLCVLYSVFSSHFRFIFIFILFLFRPESFVELSRVLVEQGWRCCQI